MVMMKSEKIEPMASTTDYAALLATVNKGTSSDGTSLKNHMNTNVFDVAKYILQQCGEMTTLKLQKLVYYSQAWSLVWDEVPLFTEEIQAWVNGPVVKHLFDLHKGKYTIDASSIQGRPEKLTKDAKETIDVVIKDYACYSGAQLREIVHHESPWIEAREGLNSNDKSQNVITIEAMKAYYSSL